jgi:hypothetical protein
LDSEITLRIVLEAPPPGVDFGIQKGRGSLFEVIQKHRSNGTDLSFEFSVGVRNADGSDTPDFSGPIVQGPRGGRFVYVDIGKVAGQLDTPWSRRLKVPLTGITAAQVRRTTSGTGGVLETRVPGTGKDGGPSCASVKDFAGWSAGR